MSTVGTEDLRDWEPLKKMAFGAFVIKIYSQREYANGMILFLSVLFLYFR